MSTFWKIVLAVGALLLTFLVAIFAFAKVAQAQTPPPGSTTVGVNIPGLGSVDFSQW
jgi:hypothetical protein